MSRSEKLGLSQFTGLSQIGKGGFGVVYRASDKRGNYVAIKKIPKGQNGCHAHDEIRAMRSLSQSHRGSTMGTNRIVKYIADFEDEDNNYIVMEYCEHGTLRDYIKKRGKLRHEIAASVLSQLVEGVMMIHRSRFMHRDLSASNVLISRTDGDQLFVKLSDFGLAKEAPTRPAIATCVGTPGYVAPQVRNKLEYGKEADVFSLGAILYFMLVGQDPPRSLDFDSQGQPKFDTPRDKVIHLNDSASDLLSRMMCCDVIGRIRLEDIDKHPFIEAAHDMVMEKMGLESVPHAKASSAPGAKTVRLGTGVRRSAADTAMETHRTSGRREIPPLQQPLPLTRPPSVSRPRPIQARAPVEVSKKVVWPFPNVSHLAYIRTNKLGRFAFLNIPLPVKSYDGCLPSAVYEMADENMNAKRIFEIYFNWTPSQRLLVFKPKRIEKIPQKSNLMLEKEQASQIRIRSEQDLMNHPDSEVRLGYKRMCQFISLAESRISQGTLRNAFGNLGYTVELKYNGTVEMTTPEGKKVIQKRGDSEPSGDAFGEYDRRIFLAGSAHLRRIIDEGEHQDVTRGPNVMMHFTHSW